MAGEKQIFRNWSALINEFSYNRVLKEDDGFFGFEGKEIHTNDSKCHEKAIGLYAFH